MGTRTNGNKKVLVDGVAHRVLNALSGGPGCIPHTYEFSGGYVYEIAGIWYLQLPGQFKRPVTVVVL